MVRSLFFFEDFFLIIFFFIPDIVFFIFLYQRWQYKVDKKRVNEFGFSAEMEEEAKMKVVPAVGNSVPVVENSVPVVEKTEDEKKDD